MVLHGRPLRLQGVQDGPWSLPDGTNMAQYGSNMVPNILPGDKTKINPFRDAPSPKRPQEGPICPSEQDRCGICVAPFVLCICWCLRTEIHVSMRIHVNLCLCASTLCSYTFIHVRSVVHEEMEGWLLGAGGNINEYCFSILIPVSRQCSLFQRLKENLGKMQFWSQILCFCMFEGT